jgi:hypothetical protein
VLPRHAVGAPGAVAPAPLGHHAREPRLRALGGHPVPQAGQGRHDLAPAHRAREGGIHAHGHEHARLARVAEVGGEHPDHLVRRVVEPHGAPDHPRVPAELLLPEAVGEHGHLVPPVARVGGGVEPAQVRAHPEEGEEVAQGARALEPGGRAVALQHEAARGVAGHRVEQFAPLAQVQHLGRGELEVQQLDRDQVLPHGHHPLDRGRRDGVQEHGADRAEDGGVGAHAQRHAEHGGEGEPGGAAEPAEGEAEVGEHGRGAGRGGGSGRGRAAGQSARSASVGGTASPRRAASSATAAAVDASVSAASPSARGSAGATP